MKDTFNTRKATKKGRDRQNWQFESIGLILWKQEKAFSLAAAARGRLHFSLVTRFYFSNTTNSSRFSCILATVVMTFLALYCNAFGLHITIILFLLFIQARKEIYLNRNVFFVAHVTYHNAYNLLLFYREIVIWLELLMSWLDKFEVEKSFAKMIHINFLNVCYSAFWIFWQSKSQDSSVVMFATFLLIFRPDKMRW